MEKCLGKPLMWMAGILSMGLVISSLVLSVVWYKNTMDKNSVITVTGSAKKQIKSDYGVWRGNFTVEASALPDAYAKIAKDLSTVKEYLISKGFTEESITVSSINTQTLYRNENYMQTTTVTGYILNQTIEIASNDVEKILSISREATELINKGVRFQSYEPQFYCTTLQNLKVDMLEDATRDAKARAEKIAGVDGRKVSAVRSARMGVFQITRPNSTDVTDYGINDTSTIDKEITAVVNAEFSLN